MRQITIMLMLFLFSCTTEPTVMIKGNLSLTDGKPATEGKLLYSRTSTIKNDQVQKIDIPTDGEFAFKFVERDEYQIIFAHPNYAPQIIFINCYDKNIYQFNVTLDRYRMPDTSQIGIVTELEGMDIAKSKPMKRSGNTWSVKIPTDKKTLNYQIHIGHRTINGEDNIVDCDDSGDFISEAKVIEGEAHIEYTFNPDNYSDSSSYYGFENVFNVAYPIGVRKFQQLYYHWALKLKEKAAVNDTTLDDLEPLFDELRSLIGTSDSQTDSLYFYSLFNTYLGSWTDEFDRDEQILSMKDNREFISGLPMNSAASYVKKMYPFDDDQDSTSVRKQREDYFQSLLNADLSPAQKISLLYAIKSHYQYIDIDESKRVYWEKQLIEDYPKSYMAVNIKQEMEMNSMLGNPAPDFTLPNRYGNEVSLAEFRGKLVLLDFWGKFCGPCIAEIPNMKAVYSEVDKSKTEFVSICVDMYEDELKTFTEERDMDWVHLYAPGWETEVSKNYHLSFVPHLVLVDSEGIIVEMDKGLRGEELSATLEKFLK